jgi:hypothetical protein
MHAPSQALHDQCRTIPAARRVLAACAMLERAGCRVISANAHGRRPTIQVNQRPRLDWLRESRKVTSPFRTVWVARIADIQIEWTGGRAHA